MLCWIIVQYTGGPSQHDNGPFWAFLLCPIERDLLMHCSLLDYRGAQPFWTKGRCVLFLGHSRTKDKILSWNFESRVYKNRFFFYLTSCFIACDFIFLPSKLFWIVISCKIVNSSTKFTFIHKSSVIQELFLVFYNLLRGPDITCSGAGSGPRVMHPCYIIKQQLIVAFEVRLCISQDYGLTVKPSQNWTG